MNAVQFNALAIIFLLGVMPFAVAFISNAGSSSDGAFEDSKAFEGTTVAAPPYSFWMNNGGQNYSGVYLASDPADFGANRTYIEDGYCPAFSTTTYPCLQFFGGLTYPGEAPMQGITIPMSHYYSTQAYIGASGDGPFSWYLQPRMIDNIQQNTAVDKFRFTFIDQNVDHNCGSSIFVNMTFEGQIEFVHDNKTKKYAGFEFDTSNKYEYQTRQANWVDVCQIGFETVFNLNGFETLDLDEFIDGDWDNTSMIITLNNFQRKDGATFGSTALPFAGGTDFFTLGIEHQEVNPVEAGFIIKTGTLVLAALTFAFAIASTPYWDPFKNAFKGAID